MRIRTIKRILLAVVILSPVGLPGQSEESDVFKYYRYKGTASRYALEGKFDSSVVYYFRAFENAEFIPESDLKSALIASRKAKDRKSTEVIAKMISEKKDQINQEYLSDINRLYKADQRAEGKYFFDVQGG